jgi:hypothetical protein
MYLRTVDDIMMQELGADTCMQCEQAGVIAWRLRQVGLLLCGECAQYLATQLLKDVRSYELDQNVTVKVRTELGIRDLSKTKRRTRKAS